MSYEPFYTRFPELAAEETRVITVLEGSPVALPAGEYGLVESFCSEPDCDCRRAFLNVITRDGGLLAVISFGWESRDFYVGWFGSDDPEIIADLKGPALALGQPQSNLAPQLLEIVVGLVLVDRAYTERIERHYQLFRSSVWKNPRVSGRGGSSKNRVGGKKRSRLNWP